jgi:CDGSH-type Zn-finger protein
MEKPEVAQKSPFITVLEEGNYYWCACGKSKNQPYCDGSHKGTGFSPVMFEIKDQTKVALCGCKYSNKKPFCDGTHKNLTDD